MDILREDGHFLLRHAPRAGESSASFTLAAQAADVFVVYPLNVPMADDRAP
jgi:hypothetical protein